MIITCASSKGGVGKSTTVACLAGAFAYSGEAVHIIDLDSNGTVSRWLADDNTRPRGITVSKPDPLALTEHLQELNAKLAPDVILIDIAGTYERALTVAMARAHLTIIPTGVTEADVFEAQRVARHLRQVYAAFDRVPLYRLLLTRVQPLRSNAQAYAFHEIERLKLPMFQALLVHRAAYEEIGLTGLPPHYADQKRPTVAKAVSDLNALQSEITALLAEQAPGKSAKASPLAHAS